MATYNLDLIFRGHDQVTGVMGGILGTFSRIGQIASGIILSRVLWGIADGITDIATSAIDATAMVQRMQVTLESLLTRELLAAKFEEGTLAVGDYEAALLAVQKPAADIMEKLAKMAILSPFTYEGVTQTYRQALAFGFTSKEADIFTQATLNMAAGIGADNDMLNRMAYNLAQIRLQGKVTALDIRQLALAGFDLRSVLKYVGQQMGVTINDHLDFNAAIEEGKITWADFTRLYADYADKYFGTASERMARTLFGLKSTFSDVFTLTMPKILGPAAEVVTVFLNRILDDFLKIRDSGILEEWGEKLRVSTEKAIRWLEEMYMNLQEFFTLRSLGLSFGDSLAKAFDLDPAIGGVIDVVITTITESLKFLSDHWEEVMLVLGAIAASGVIATIVSVLTLLGSVLAAIVSPLGLVVVAIGALWLAWQNNWGGIREIVAELWKSIEEMWVKVKPYFDQFIAVVSELATEAFAALGEEWNNIWPVLVAGWEAIKPAIDRFIQMIADNWPMIMENFKMLGDFVIFLIPIIGALIVILLAIFVGLINGIITAATLMEQAYLHISHGLFTFFKGIGEFIQGWFTMFIGWITFDGEKIKSGFFMLWEGIKHIFGGAIEFIFSLIALQFAGILGLVSGFIDGVVRFFTSLYDQLVGHSIVPDLVNGVLKWFTKLVNEAGTIVNRIVSLVTNPFNTVANLINRISSSFDRLSNTMWNVVNTAWSVANALSNINVPSYLLGHSPSPFENSLVGINKALSQTNRLAQAFSMSAPDMESGSRGRSARAGGGKNIEKVEFNFRDTDLTPESLRWAMNRLSYD